MATTSSLEDVRKSRGTVLALSDQQLLASLRDWALNESILLSPEGAASTAAYDHLIDIGFLKKSDRVVLFNTGSGSKYTDVFARHLLDAGPTPRSVDASIR